MSAPPGPPGDGAAVTVRVEVPQADAFAVFTEEIDLWWRHGPRFRVAGRAAGQLTFEPGPGGRLLETFPGRSGPRTFVVGRVLAWEPPARLLLEWRIANFRPGELTHVEVTFAPSGDGGDATLVTVRHRGFASLRDGHPARHGLVGAEVSRMIGGWWGDLLSALREHVAGRWPPTPC